MKYESTKTYGHDLGLSACFRQWKADSHCNKLHGYALSFKFTFGANELDERNWVFDFGGLKELKTRLVGYFDHKTVVAQDDPLLDLYKEMHVKELADLVILPRVGCEAFAELAYGQALAVIQKHNRSRLGPRVFVLSCECAEHGANSAIYRSINA